MEQYRTPTLLPATNDSPAPRQNRDRLPIWDPSAPPLASDYPMQRPMLAGAQKVRMLAELDRLNAEDERVALLRDSPNRATRSFAPCPQPARRVVLVGETSEWWTLRCKRWSCPGCREWQTAEVVDRIDNAFDGRDAYEATFDRSEWNAVYQRLRRQQVDYVNLPGPGDTVHVLTHEPLAESGPAAMARELTEAVVRSRPLGKGLRWSSGGSHEWRESLTAEKKQAPAETPVLLGTWDHRLPIHKIAQRAVDVGLIPEVLDGDGAERIVGLRFSVPWDDDRYAELRRWVGFTLPDHTPADPAPDPVLDGESWDVIAVYLDAM